MVHKERNPTIDKLALGSRVGGTNVLGNSSVYLLIESAQEGDPVFEAPEELTISMKVRFQKISVFSLHS